MLFLVKSPVTAWLDIVGRFISIIYYISFFRFCNLADCYAARFKDLSVDKDAELVRYKEYAERVRPMVTETISYLHKELQDGKKVLVEGANAAMLDIDFGKLKEREKRVGAIDVKVRITSK